MKPAFSTIACPEWALEDVAEFAGRTGYQGVELRTFGHASTELACDPCKTGPSKIRDLFEDAGVAPLCLASSIRYDKPVWPPIVGHMISDTERPVRQTKSLVEVAAQCEVEAVRVFAFELAPGEKREKGIKRVLGRLEMALSTCRNTGVKLILENAGSFPLGEDIGEIIERAGSPLLYAAYNPAVAQASGEDPIEGARLLGARLWSVKLSDYRQGAPVTLGEGDLGAERVVTELAQMGFPGWLVYEWPRLWLRELDEPTDILTNACEKMYRWIGAATPSPAGVRTT